MNKSLQQKNRIFGIYKSHRGSRNATGRNDTCSPAVAFVYIKGYEKLYWVNKIGQIKNKFNFIAQKDNGTGYLQVSLSKNGVNKFFLVHRIVAQTFLENNTKKIQVNHKDGNSKNNCVENLEWVTPTENIQHSIKIGTHINPPSSKKLSEKQVLKIRVLYGIKSQKEIAKIYHIDRSMVSYIWNRKVWKHI